MFEAEQLPAELEEPLLDEALPSADRKEREHLGDVVRAQQRDIKAAHRQEMREGAAKAWDAEAM